MSEFFQQVWDTLCAIVVNFRQPEKWPEAFAGAFWPALATVAVIVFAETGLLVGFFLPGDSLLVTFGIVARTANWDIFTILAVLIVAAIVGDSVGYWIGAKAGPAIFNRPSSRWFKRDHLLAAKAFFDKHGGKTLIFARFMPFARTFVPVVAGAAKMGYRQFVVYNVVGGVAWIVSMVLFGYFATDVLEPPLKKVFGDDFELKKKIDVLAAVIIVLSVLPMVVHYLLERRKKKREKLAEASVQPPVPTP